MEARLEIQVAHMAAQLLEGKTGDAGGWLALLSSSPKAEGGGGTAHGEGPW
jgi:hypothetical protein